VSGAFCRPLFDRAIGAYVTDHERRAFASGFIHGQAEKIYLGACDAACSGRKRGTWLSWQSW
jgi:hypothetical protein